MSDSKNEEHMGRLGRAQKLIRAMLPYAMRGKNLPKGGVKFRCPLCQKETEMLRPNAIAAKHSTFCALTEFI